MRIKAIIGTLFLAGMIFLTGCGGKDKASTGPAGKVSVVASFYPMYLMACNVTKDVPGVSVVNMTSNTFGCLHDYAITTADMKRLAVADVFVTNGAGMESFLDKVAAQYPRLKIVQLAEGIPLIKGHGEEGDNPHVWVSVSNAITQVRNLGKALAEFDQPHAELYRKNIDGYVAKLDALRARMKTELEQFRGRKIVMFHEAFPYFAQEFGLEIAAVIEREPGSAPSAKELAETIDLVKAAGVKALFSEPQYPSAAADAIARETGARVYVLDPAVTGPDALDAYIKAMEKNLTVLKEALQ